MARSRQIKHTFFRDEELGELPRDCRFLFIGLWTLADREGRLEDRPGRIRADLFPYDPDFTAQMVAAFLDLLAAEGWIVRYVVDGKRFMWIPDFVKHQPIHPTEKASTIPPPPEQTTGKVDTSPTTNGEVTGNPPAVHGEVTEGPQNGHGEVKAKTLPGSLGSPGSRYSSLPAREDRVKPVPWPPHEPPPPPNLAEITLRQIPSATDLTQTYARVREALGQGIAASSVPRMSAQANGETTSLAERIEASPHLRDRVVPSMALLMLAFKAGTHEKAADALKAPNLGFAIWRADFENRLVPLIDGVPEPTPDSRPGAQPTPRPAGPPRAPALPVLKPFPKGDAPDPAALAAAFAAFDRAAGVVTEETDASGR